MVSISCRLGQCSSSWTAVQQSTWISKAESLVCAVETWDTLALSVSQSAVAYSV